MSAELYAPEREDLWGYAKRLRFVREAMRDAFPRAEARRLRVLDVGCGNGSQLALPLARGAAEIYLTGIDTDARSIEHAKQLAERRRKCRVHLRARGRFTFLAAVRRGDSFGGAGTHEAARRIAGRERAADGTERHHDCDGSERLWRVRD